MAITDLTNTTWFLNDYINSVDLPFATYYVDFKSFDATFTYLQVDEDMSYGYYIKYGSLVVYDSDMNGQWSSQNYRTITITGGNDITNPNLITWLETNGELISGGEEEKTPTLTYDLSQLDLPEGTHSITVVAKADGYSNSAPSNAVEFVVESNLISFTIAGTSYQAEEGMTFGEWIESEYNTNGFRLGGRTGIEVTTSDGKFVATNNYTPMQSTNVITANENYIVAAGGSVD